MKTDRELLQLAAKAAGHEVWTDIDGNLYTGSPERRWNPLGDDGDALRLAVKLQMRVTIYPFCADASSYGKDDLREIGDDSLSATRRAIVRAAAEVGESMPK